MINLTKLSEVLKTVPSFILSSEKKDKILEQSKILYELNDFLCKKYNISPDEAETKLKIFLAEKAKSGAPDLKAVISWASDFSKSEGFPKSDELAIGLEEVIKIIGPLAGVKL